ncbi:MAG: LysM domain-containing protein [Desulfosporosinus sp.]|nr:LysM domain-containing protein [Desulfosporosinus sp.]
MYYYVQPGDSLHSIAMAYNTTIGDLMDLNPQIRNPHRIHVGERIKVSSGKHWGGRQWGRNEWRRNESGHHDSGNHGHSHSW